MTHDPYARRTTRRLAAATLLMWCGVTLGHYLTDHHAAAFHNVYRRLYYVPIVLAAFAYGRRGGLGVASLSSLAYIPHAFLLDHHHRDPAPTEDKLLEIVMYGVVGGLSGWLVERQRQVQRRLEQSLRERDALAAQLIRAGKLGALGELTSGLAHELRNPLASIMGSAEALCSEFPPEHRKHRIAQLMLREIDRMSRVVSEFLAFARPSTPTMQPLDLRQVVEHVISISAHHPDCGRLSLEDELEPEALIVRGDADQLAQVLLNLVLNAAQSLREHEAPKVRLEATRHDVAGAWHQALVIEDNGPGIKPEHLHQIFDPYFTTRADGSGLGLSISHRIMEAHGGFLDVQSEPGRTRFLMIFPPADAALVTP